MSHAIRLITGKYIISLVYPNMRRSDKMLLFECTTIGRIKVQGEKKREVSSAHPN
jgi:hypothetical protein